MRQVQRKVQKPIDSLSPQFLEEGSFINSNGRHGGGVGLICDQEVQTLRTQFSETDILVQIQYGGFPKPSSGYLADCRQKIEISCGEKHKLFFSAKS